MKILKRRQWINPKGLLFDIKNRAEIRLRDFFYQFAWFRTTIQI